MTMKEAREAGLLGWNLRCELCGEHPADWKDQDRGDSIALCPRHAAEYDAEVKRHNAEISRLKTRNYYQLAPFEVAAIVRAERKAARQAEKEARP